MDEQRAEDYVSDDSGRLTAGYASLRPLAADVQIHVDRGTDRLALQLDSPPSAAPDAPLVVVVPAMGTPARYYRFFAADLRAAGIRPAVVDLRGTGASTPRPTRASRYGYAELAEDIDAVLRLLPGAARDAPSRSGR